MKAARTRREEREKASESCHEWLAPFRRVQQVASIDKQSCEHTNQPRKPLLLQGTAEYVHALPFGVLSFGRGGDQDPDPGFQLPGRV